MFLIDVDVICELGKAERCDRGVAAWYASTDDDDLFLSVLVTAEIRRTIERTRYRDQQRAIVLGRWLKAVEQAFGERILPIDLKITNTWAKMSAIGDFGVINSLLAATALTYDLTLVTSAAYDNTGFGAEVLNPFGKQP